MICRKIKNSRGSVLFIIILTILLIGGVGFLILKNNEQQESFQRKSDPEPTDSAINTSSENSDKPYAWMGQAYSGKIGRPITFDASGSHGTYDSPITRYEWDFDADGIYDLETKESSATYTYRSAFNDLVTLRVTNKNGTATHSANSNQRTGLRISGRRRTL